MLKKFLSVFLTVLLVIQIVPLSVFAEDMSSEELTSENYETTVAESYIVGEDISKRDENTKHFRCADGRYMAVSYNYPVHYIENGKWEELDFSLQQKTDEKGDTVYSTPEQLYQISVPENIGDGALTYSYGEYKVSLSYQGSANPGQSIKKSNKKAKIKKSDSKKKLKASKSSVKEYNSNYMTLENAGSTVVYEEVEKNLSFNYDVSALGIKEDIIVSSPQNNYKYEYILETEGLIPKSETDNSIVLSDSETNNIVYRIDAPVMYDNAGVASDAIKLKLKEKQGKYELTVEADKKWINAEDRVFPVTIDPTVRLDIGRSKIDDTYVDSKTPTIPHHNSYDLYVGRNSLGLTRSYVKFELPKLPEYSMVVGAAFSMYLYESDIYTSTMSSAVMNLYDLSSQASWTSNSITWNNQPVSNAYNGANALTVIDYCDYGSAVGFAYNWDITKIAKGWYSGGTNNGVLVAASDESVAPLRVRFVSSDSPAVSGAGIPQLIVSYRDTRGLEDYWSYSSYSAGDAGTAYINDYNGQLVFVRNDVSTFGQRMPVTVSGIYNLALANKQSAYTSYTGNGWQLSVQQSVKATASVENFSELITNYPYVYNDGDGTAHYLAKTSTSNVFEDEDGLGLKMTYNSSNSSATYVIKDNNDNVMTFNSDGDIVSISDANGNKITMSYSGSKLTKITDGASHSITIANDSAGNITSMTAVDERNCTYTYTSGNLTSAKMLNGKNVKYEYDANGRMTKAVGSDSSELRFTYLSNSGVTKVSAITVYSNGTLTQTVYMDYSQHNETRITSSGNEASVKVLTRIETVKQFDDFGRLISSYDETAAGFAYAANCSYVAHKNEADDAKNHIATVGEMGKAVINAVVDPSFEHTDAEWKITTVLSNLGSAAFSSEQYLYGKKSMKISLPSYSKDEKYREYQDLDVSLLTEGKTYTASVYAKVDSCTAENGGGVFLQVRTESSGESKSYYSEYITSKTDTSVNNGWRRLSLTFTIPTELTRCYVAFGFKNAKGTAYFDAVQVEESDVANDYNLVENGGLEQGGTAWTYPKNDTSNGHFNSFKYDGKLSYRLYGKPFAEQSISQVINLSPNASEKETYILSAWVRADALSNQFHKTNRDKKFGIGAKITYSDGKVCDKYIPANFAVSDWQFVSGAFTLSDETSSVKVPVSITVYGIYKNQSNKVNFDNFSLVKEDVPSYTYNSKGNLVSAVENAKGNQKMSYSANGVDMTQYENAASDVYTYTYDGKHNLTSATSKRGIKYNYSYDDYGNVLSLIVNNTDTSKTESISSSITYTDNGSLVASTTDSAGGTTTYSYQNNTGNVYSVTDTMGNKTSYTYDAGNYNLTQTSGAYKKVGTDTALATSVKYSYDGNNRLTKIQAKSPYTFTYDANGNLTTASAGEKLLVTNTYNLNTNALKSVAYGNNKLLQQYEYDNLGRLVGLVNNAVKVGEWKYDGKDRIAVYNDIRNTQKHLFSYDVLGRFTRESVLNNADNSLIYASEYSYDRNNNIDKIGIVSGNTGVSMSYTYGQDNLPDAYTANTNSGAYTYDSLNRLSGKTSSITPQTEYAYNDGTAQISNENWGHTAIAYLYDSNGNITHMLTNPNTSLSGLEALKNMTAVNYSYDEFNRLIEEYDSKTTKTIRYSYDRWGNMSSKKVYDSSDNLEKTYSYKYTSSDDTTQWNDLLVKYNGKSITYDAIGNPTNYMGATMYWEGRTLTEQIKNGTTITYSYDSSDMRTSKTVGGVKHNYYYVQGKLMYEDCPSYKLFYSYDAYGNLSEIKRILSDGTAESFGVHCNIFGDVTEIYYNDRILAAKYSYDSWGKLLSVTDSMGNDVMGDNEIWTQNSIRYRGYVYDEESQLYYLQSRYYDPETCRFINADDTDVLKSAPLTMNCNNLFTYCDCNPICRLDENGEFWGAIIGGIGGAVFGAIDAHMSGDKVWSGALVGGLTGAASGLLIDATVASGGTLAFAAAIGGSGILNAINTVAIDELNGRSFDGAAFAKDFMLGCLFGALDFGISGGTLAKRPGKWWKNMVDDFVDVIKLKPKKSHGKTKKPTAKQTAKYAAINLTEQTFISSTLTIFNGLFSLIYTIRK